MGLKETLADPKYAELINSMDATLGTNSKGESFKDALMAQAEVEEQVPVLVNRAVKQEGRARGIMQEPVLMQALFSVVYGAKVPVEAVATVQSIIVAAYALLLAHQEMENERVEDANNEPD